MTLSEIRASLTNEDILQILAKYDIKPTYIGSSYMIFPTCCHNVNGGKPKLYYYYDSHLFRCYTECNTSFDIFELLIKMAHLRNEQLTLYGALLIANVNPNELNDEIGNSNYQKKLDYMYEFTRSLYTLPHIEAIDEQVLNASIFKEDVLSIWEQEGISLATMRKYKIGYDPINNCITIPIYDHTGQLVSVRGRFLAEDAEAKYKPITFCNKLLAVPSSQILYGLYQTKDAISKSKTAILFESEKSVLMMDTFYGDKNNSVATLGKNISNQHILMLKNAGAEHVILAYDADYKSAIQLKLKLKEYTKIAKTLAPFFSVSILMDWNNELPYKASPIDCGKEIFENILRKQHYVTF